MFKHLLVTLDGSPRAEAVIPHTADLARTMGAEVTLLRIIDTSSADWGERGAIGKAPSISTVQSIYTEQAKSYLDRIAAQLRKDGITTHTVVKAGQPAKQIIAAAHEADADAIAMATHSRRGMSRLMFGSVAEEVLHESSLPILLIRAA
jgi:nucleotide-binding universal stress UspA family protein